MTSAAKLYVAISSAYGVVLPALLCALVLMSSHCWTLKCVGTMFPSLMVKVLVYSVVLPALLYALVCVSSL